MLTAGLLGYIGGRIAPGKFRVGGGHGASGQRYGPALIDDDTPTPEHARFKLSRMLAMTAALLSLWAGGLWLIQGIPVLEDMNVFFTKAALITFGGAYAVLPYVYQGGVETHGWLGSPQMMDGLALGETTPGPLIMVVTFVGYLGAWTKQAFGPDNLFLAGCAGACVATYFTFLHSYLLILAGGLLVEATHGDLKFTAPLTGITPAVVGVILNLALFFAWHVLWPGVRAAAPFAGTFAGFSALLSLAAFIAQWRYRQNIMNLKPAVARMENGLKPNVSHVAEDRWVSRAG